mmetsp:Transcript_45839/g.33580  ORF Transcript_45839/g.33580 Transcript_45839/m.33580 type:complete len:83 (-) Transcript_45839:238-486(-)
MPVIEGPGALGQENKTEGSFRQEGNDSFFEEEPPRPKIVDLDDEKIQSLIYAEKEDDSIPDYNEESKEELIFSYYNNKRLIS